jgi:MinD-like ATPase involved in chromosome partitioning or flagellar assembly
MKTLTFYSYKGGVGRSLVLANLAQRLVEFGKSVCMLDFDLEAPGLPFKFGARKILDMKKKGVVDFVTEYQNSNPRKPMQKLDESYYTLLNGDRKNQAPLHLITAGNTDSSDYWKNLSAIDWKEMFYSEDGQGYKLMLHLKALIEKELAPDYLLIDSRTGVTETSGIALSILADRVVMVAANNEENLYGSKMIIRSIQQEKQPTGKTADVHFILSRVPFYKDANERLREKDRNDRIAEDFKRHGIEIAYPEIMVIHSQRELEEDERLMIGEYDFEMQIGYDYRHIFKNIICADFNFAENEKYINQEKAAIMYNVDFPKATDLDEKIGIIEECLSLDENAKYYLWRGKLYKKVRTKENQVIADFLTAISLDPFDWQAYYELSEFYYFQKNQRDKALHVINQAMENIPDDGFLLSLRAEFSDVFEEKEADLKKAIALEPDGGYNLDLAELYFEYGIYDMAYTHGYIAMQEEPNNRDALYLFAKLQYIYKGNKDEFYLNLDRALSLDKMDLIADEFSFDEFFRPFLNEERFKRLLYKYNIEMKLPPEAPKADAAKNE